MPTASELTAALGGGVTSALTVSPDGTRTAFLWTPRQMPMWYRVGIAKDDLDVVLTPRAVRVWGKPCWSSTGQLAVGGFVGVRRIIFDVDVETAAVAVVAEDPEASCELLEYLGDGSAVVRRHGLDGSVAKTTTGSRGEEVVKLEREPLRAWQRSELVRWRSRGRELEGIFVRGETGEPPWPVVTFLHGGPVGSLAAGQAERVEAWTDPRWATFIPEFPASGICGEAAMVDAFEARELPDDDHEVEAILDGVQALVRQGKADESRLFLVGHSYGAYLVNRAVTRTDRFRSAVCWEGVADLRRLTGASAELQTTWKGGSPTEAPERWSAASPIDRADRVRTPILLVYGADSAVAPQGAPWYDALTRAGVQAELVVIRGQGHTFDPAGLSEFHARVAAWFGR